MSDAANKYREKQHMKKCFKCGKILPLSDFYTHPEMADGRLGKCKECAKADVRSNRSLRAGQYAAFEVRRNKTEARKAYRAAHLKNYRAKNSEKVKAHRAVQRAVASGRLVRPLACDECGAASDGTRRTQIHAHHDDYSHPFNVRWLCPACHVQRHAIARIEQHREAS